MIFGIHECLRTGNVTGIRLVLDVKRFCLSVLDACRSSRRPQSGEGYCTACHALLPGLS